MGHGYTSIYASIQLKNSEQDLFQISDNVSVSCSQTHCAFFQGEIIEARPGWVGSPAKSSKMRLVVLVRMWDLVASPGAREEHNRCARYRHHHNSASRHTTSRKGRTQSRKHKFASFAVVFLPTILHGWFGKTITTEKAAPPAQTLHPLIWSHLH